MKPPLIDQVLEVSALARCGANSLSLAITQTHSCRASARSDFNLAKRKCKQHYLFWFWSGH
jgi:hypothetical protein